jgi:flagellar hook-associated protein 1
MSMLSNAVSGLNAASSGMNVSGNNVANAAVKSYSRQTVYLATADGPLNGVKVTRIERIVDGFLNDDIWRTSSDLSYYQTYSNYLGFMEQVLGTDSLNLKSSVANINAALSAALVSPESQAYRQQVLSTAESMVQDVTRLNDALVNNRKQLMAELDFASQAVNGVLAKIAELNGGISKAQALGEPVSELMDAREAVVLELSGLIEVSYLDQADGTISVSSMNGAPLVIGTRHAELSVSGTEVSATFNQQTFSLDARVGGKIGGLLSVDADVLIPAMGQLGQLIADLSDAVNTGLSQGFDLQGLPGEPLFVYDIADPMGSFRLNPDMTTSKLAFTGGMDDGIGNWIPRGGIGDNANIHQLISLLDTSMPGYEALIGDLAMQSMQVQSSIRTSRTLNDNAAAARDRLSGVNLDEEAANLMFYQKLYEANAKVISTADQMFKTLINMF